jgi:sugar/nucleoside kinase (ribokinase family)
MERARLVGLTVSIDASSEAPLLAVGPETFLGWLAPTDVLFANAAEARALTGTADAARAVDALVMRGLTAVVKVGGDGALAGSREGRWRAPASPAIAQDSTGAGDAFAAGFLACWTRNGDMEAALDSATRTAARAVSRPGGRP